MVRGRQIAHFIVNISCTMESSNNEKITRSLLSQDNPLRLFIIVIGVAVILGAITGYTLSNKGGGGLKTAGLGNQAAKNPESDTGTFRDFAEGVIKPRPEPKDPEEYVEGTHLLEREGAVSVALTSSVVDLSLYEGKKVKVLGETQKALKEGWLMDVGKVEEIK